VKTISDRIDSPRVSDAVSNADARSDSTRIYKGRESFKLLSLRLKVNLYEHNALAWHARGQGFESPYLHEKSA